MKSPTILVIGIINTLLIILWITIVFGGMKHVDADANLHYSKNIASSMKNGFFIGYYVLVKDSGEIYDGKSEISRIWIEKNWTTNTGFFRTDTVINPGYNIIAPFKMLAQGSRQVEVSFREYSFSNFYCSNEDIELGYVERFDHLPDTIFIKIDGGTLHAEHRYIREKVTF